MIGDNSILFDFFSIVDKELSALKYIFKNYDYFKSLNILNIDKIDQLSKMSIDDLKLERMYGCKDIFESIFNTNKNHRMMLKYFYDKYENFILDDKEYLVFTDSLRLILAYSKAADGVIKSTVLCENDMQKSVVDKYILHARPVISDKKSIDLNLYARLVVGDIYDAANYNIDNPNSLVVMNFRDNFKSDDINNLIPELVISLGDISSISICVAYDVLHGKKIEG